MTGNVISGAINVCRDELRAAKDRGSILVALDIKDTYERDTGAGERCRTHSELGYKAAFVSRPGRHVHHRTAALSFLVVKPTKVS